MPTSMGLPWESAGWIHVYTQAKQTAVEMDVMTMSTLIATDACSTGRMRARSLMLYVGCVEIW